MVIAVHYFASIREALDCELEKLELPDGVGTVNELIAHLVSTHGEKWISVFDNTQVLVAVNHEMTDRDAVIAPGDEVAFFPPVTGG
jgi:molybdopterin synthase sulfur carrier subunit